MSTAENQNNKKQQLLKDLSGELKEFYEFHGVQMLSWGMPPTTEFIEQLYNKLKNQTMDAGEHFQILDNGDEETYQAKVIKDLQKDTKVFLIDHSITFRYEELRIMLEKDEALLGRLQNMLKYWDEKIKIPGVTPEDKKFKEIAEFDFQDIEDPNTKKIPLNCQVLSLYGNNISDLEKVKQVLSKLPDLKVLYLNENPVAENEELYKMIEEDFKHIEILNSKYTKFVTEYGLKFTTFGQGHLDQVQKVQNKDVKHLDISDRGFLELEDQSLFEKFENLEELTMKETEITELGQINKFLALLKICKKLVHLNVEQEVELVVMELFKQKKLSEVNSSLRYINGHDLLLEQPPHQNEEIIRKVMKNIWKIAGCYRLASTEKYDQSGIWYVPDELGVSVQHSDQFNSKLVPFLYAPNNKLDEKSISYSLLWNTQDLKEGDLITVDYLKEQSEKQARSCKLYTWFQVPTDFFEKKFEEDQKKKNSLKSQGEELLNNFKEEELKREELKDDVKLKIATDVELIYNNMKLPQFEYVTDPFAADVCWFLQDPAYFKELVDAKKFINQFPYESCITMKNNLTTTIYDNLGQVDWFQPSYDLTYELCQFMGDFITRQKNRDDNIWILKPPNMARSMDMVVTDNLDIILRQLETGPKLVQKYIERPLTINNKKMDFRYIIILKSLKPLDLYFYDKFWVRTGNNIYSNDYRTREIYDTHFTVMNYGKKLQQIHDYEYLEMFEKEYGNQIKWAEIQQKIYQMVKHLFIGVQKGYPQMQNDKCCAVYGLDVMIDLNGFQPKMLEMNFSPDCTRACKFNPTFFEDIVGFCVLNKDHKKCNLIKV